MCRLFRSSEVCTPGYRWSLIWKSPKVGKAPAGYLYKLSGYSVTQYACLSVHPFVSLWSTAIPYLPWSYVYVEESYVTTLPTTDLLTHSHARTHERTHAHTHTHTHIQVLSVFYISIFSCLPFLFSPLLFYIHHSLLFIRLPHGSHCNQWQTIPHDTHTHIYAHTHAVHTKAGQTNTA